MQSYVYVYLFAIFVLLNSFLAVPVDEEQKSQDIKLRVEPTTTALIASALVPLVMNALSGLIGSLFKPADYQDTVLYGRSCRIKMCGTSCVQITDRGSGITVVGTGNSTQEAIGDASHKLFNNLLDKRILSLHDLCFLHISFPHPDQENCPGLQINTCDLISVVHVTKPACTNKMTDRYCEKHAARCNDHHQQHFMLENCYKKCTNNCQEVAEDPCVVKPDRF